ncbi:MAG: S8 family peptidase [Crocinitomicaceae bacterium]
MRRLMNFIALALFLVAFTVQAQDYDKDKLNWYNQTKYGMSTDKAYKKLLKDKTSKTVIVAVIDSGVDIEHEDLEGKIWTNEDEIPDNGIDDDNNGYIDDVHGWSFLGNPDGENIEHEQLEMTRLYAKYDKIYGEKEADDIADDEKEEYELYLEVKEKVEAEIQQSEATMKQIESLYDMLSKSDSVVKKALGKDDYTNKELKKLVKKDKEVGVDAELLLKYRENGMTTKLLERYIKYFEGSLEYHYNTEYNARKIVGDDPSDFNDKYYGSNDVEGPDAMHGTHCSGIIGATRNNGLGNDGVANDILIMSIRAVPDGDERDKDIALAIRYAVDNGAQVVNMSFGKSYSPYKEEVIAAIRYAEEHDVLLVHAAGNDGKDIGTSNNFPSPKYESMEEEFSNWIEVGASTRFGKAKEPKKFLFIKRQGNPGLAATFSNYSEEHVDIYAPGLEIYSTVPQSEYQESQGTSMAAPMITGLAALLKSYFPELTMLEIREIILKSGQDVAEVETPCPGDTKVVLFKTLCETGKIANTYNAVEMAIEMTEGK